MDTAPGDFREPVRLDFDRAPESGSSAPMVLPPVSRQLEQVGARIDVPAVDPIAALGLSAPAQSPLGSSSVAGKTPTPALQEGSGVVSARPTTRPYSGTPVSLDFQQADLKSVLRVFAEISSLNVVIDPAAVGKLAVIRDRLVGRGSGTSPGLTRAGGSHWRRAEPGP